MIYETDTDLMLVWSGSAWVEIASMLTKAPRGVMGYVKRTAGNTSIDTTVKDVTGVSITFTAVSGRLYKTTFSCMTQKSTNGYINFFITDGSNNIIYDYFENIVSGEYAAFTIGGVLTGLSGSVTIKIRANTSAGTGTVYGSTGNPSSFIIEDIGAA
jgi:hypothetical protein